MTARGTNLPRVKKQNEALIKEIIYKYGPISRSKIAEMLSLTPPTITTNVTSLIERLGLYMNLRQMILMWRNAPSDANRLRLISSRRRSMLLE